MQINILPKVLDSLLFLAKIVNNSRALHLWQWLHPKDNEFVWSNHLRLQQRPMIKWNVMSPAMRNAPQIHLVITLQTVPGRLLEIFQIYAHTYILYIYCVQIEFLTNKVSRTSTSKGSSLIKFIIIQIFSSQWRDKMTKMAVFILNIQIFMNRYSEVSLPGW